MKKDYRNSKTRKDVQEINNIYVFGNRVFKPGEIYEIEFLTKKGKHIGNINLELSPIRIKESDFSVGISWFDKEKRKHTRYLIDGQKKS